MYLKRQSYDVWFMRYGVWRTKLFVILDHFLHFYPPDNPKNQNLKNIYIKKKKTGDIITLHMCTINDNHMTYGSWNMECDGHNFLSFWTIFCPFTPLTAWKIKIKKKWKQHLEISPFYKSVPKIMIVCYTVPEIWHVTDVIVIFPFGLFFALLLH